MKNLPFHRRLRFAFSGIRHALHSEKSFRTQVGCAVLAVVALVALRPDPVWAALFALTIGGVLALELINTALEKVVDHLHPQTHPMIGLAKDCAAGGVLVMSLVSLVVFAAFLISRFCPKGP